MDLIHHKLLFLVSLTTSSPEIAARDVLTVMHGLCINKLKAVATQTPQSFSFQDISYEMCAVNPVVDQNRPPTQLNATSVILTTIFVSETPLLY